MSANMFDDEADEDFEGYDIPTAIHYGSSNVTMSMSDKNSRSMNISAQRPAAPSNQKNLSLLGTASKEKHFAPVSNGIATSVTANAKTNTLSNRGAVTDSWTTMRKTQLIASNQDQPVVDGLRIEEELGKPEHNQPFQKAIIPNLLPNYDTFEVEKPIAGFKAANNYSIASDTTVNASQSSHITIMGTHSSGNVLSNEPLLNSSPFDKSVAAVHASHRSHMIMTETTSTANILRSSAILLNEPSVMAPPNYEWSLADPHASQSSHLIGKGLNHPTMMASMSSLVSNDIFAPSSQEAANFSSKMPTGSLSFSKLPPIGTPMNRTLQTDLSPSPVLYGNLLNGKANHNSTILQGSFQSVPPGFGLQQQTQQSSFPSRNSGYWGGSRDAPLPHCEVEVCQDEASCISGLKSTVTQPTVATSLPKTDNMSVTDQSNSSKNKRKKKNKSTPEEQRQIAFTAPKSALHIVYGKAPRRKVISGDHFHTFHDGGPAHLLRWTCIFVCPISGELFLAVPYHSGGSSVVDTYPSETNNYQPLWCKYWFTKKLHAEHGAAASAHDCLVYRDRWNQASKQEQRSQDDESMDDNLYISTETPYLPDSGIFDMPESIVPQEIREAILAQQNEIWRINGASRETQKDSYDFYGSFLP